MPALQERLAGEGELGDGLNDDVGRTGSRIADGDAGGEQREVDELTSVDGQALDLLFIDHRAHHGACRFGNFSYILH